MKSNMYDETKTWNPFKGCLFDCVYCRPSFQQQAKRQMHRCMDCYNYVPHYHPDRLNKIPSKPNIFVCGNSDICFCRRASFVFDIIEAIKKHNRRRPDKIYYFQSKRPEYFKQFLNDFPTNAVLLTTLETNRDEGYRKISKAPVPTERYRQFLSLDFSRKVVTIEPVLDFDLDVFVDWITTINPMYVWLGYNSRSEQVQLPEPDDEKMARFIRQLRKNRIPIKFKTISRTKTKSNEKRGRKNV